MNDRDSNFLNRWSRRKTLLRNGGAAPDAAAPVPVLPGTASATAGSADAVASAPEPRAEMATPPANTQPAPTLADVAGLSPLSDYTRFVAEGVAPEVKNAALKKLFTDPHFNVMDGLDTYIDDYGKPDPLPSGMLRQLAQSKLLGLFDDEEQAGDAAAGLPSPLAPAALDVPGAADDAAPH
jgi:hypothetical protein